MVRHASTSDIPGIRALMRTVPGFWQPWWSDKTIADAMGLAFVWEDNSKIFGFVCAHDLGFRAYLASWLSISASAIRVSEPVWLGGWKKLSVTFGMTQKRSIGLLVGVRRMLCFLDSD
jgi:hypothetical protein